MTKEKEYFVYGFCTAVALAAIALDIYWMFCARKVPIIIGEQGNVIEVAFPRSSAGATSASPMTAPGVTMVPAAPQG